MDSHNRSKRETIYAVERSLSALRSFPLDPETYVIVGQHSSPSGGTVSLFPKTLDIAVELASWLRGTEPHPHDTEGRAVRGSYDGATFIVYAPKGHDAGDILAGMSEAEAVTA